MENTVIITQNSHISEHKVISFLLLNEDVRICSLDLGWASCISTFAKAITARKKKSGKHCG